MRNEGKGRDKDKNEEEGRDKDKNLAENEDQVSSPKKKISFESLEPFLNILLLID